GAASFGPATLSISFYVGNPDAPAAFLVATHTQPGITITSNGAASYSFTNAGLNTLQTLFAVVNVNTAGSNGNPPLPYNLSNRLLVVGEGNTVNNVSPLFTTTACGQAALLRLSNTGSIDCNNLANYQ